MCTILGHGHQCGKAIGCHKLWGPLNLATGGGAGHPQSQAWATSGAPNHPQPLHANPNGPVGAGGALGLGPRGPHHPTMGSVGRPGRYHIQPPPQALASCYCQGLKFCMDGRNTMLHGPKLRVLPKKIYFEPHSCPCGPIWRVSAPPMGLANLKASNFACMAAMLCCIMQNWGLCHKTQIVSPTPANWVRIACAAHTICPGC